MITHNKSLLTILFLAAAVGGSTSQAGVILGLLNGPPTTAGVALSTRSGPNTWHLYAIEDAASSDLGIGSYNIVIPGATAINHRSPNGTAVDGNGDVQNWGFTLLRSGTNVNPIVASLPLMGTTPFVITGFGREASNATAKITAIDPNATSITANSGANWGSYAGANPPYPFSALKNFEQSVGHKWMFIAEGAGNIKPSEISGTFTVLSNPQGAQLAGTFNLLLNFFCEQCGPPVVADKVFNDVNASDPGSVAYTFTPGFYGANSWSGLTFVSGPTPTVPATFDAATQQFNWTTIGSPIGSYKWSVQATNGYGSDTGFVTVNITVPNRAPVGSRL
jgi:hypothetical protein